MNQVDYEQDYYLWTQAMVKALKKRDYSSIDWDNLIEEIEDMGKSQKIGFLIVNRILAFGGLRRIINEIIKLLSDRRLTHSTI